jgi:hypothetical protein
MPDIEPTLHLILNALNTHKFFLMQLWLMFFLIGTFVLYIGFGFVMSAVSSKQKGKSQTVVYVIDIIISCFFLLLDVLLNVLVYPIVCLDLRPKNIFTTISHRMSRYNSDENEWHYRRVIASLFGAALDGKDPSGDHVKGPNIYFKWLGTV